MESEISIEGKEVTENEDKWCQWIGNLEYKISEVMGAQG